MARSRLRTFLYENGLSLVLLALFLLSLIGQIFTGYRVYNEARRQHGAPEVALSQYIFSGDSLEALFENWESEFLQMALYVILTIHLRQKGSSESKPIDKKFQEVDEDPRKHRNDPKAPWPVKRGGIILRLYEYSLSAALLLLFLISWISHAVYGARKQCEDQMRHGGTCEGFASYMASADFWFESFQNWQSEFLSVAAIVILSVFLRQRGSPESKPVHKPHSETAD
jgi:hypothetical protein